MKWPMIPCLLIAACGARETPEPRADPVRRVLIIGLDGTRPDCLMAAATPRLDSLLEQAAFSMQAQTQSQAPTNSAPGWMSVLTGVEPGKHGVVANGEYGQRDSNYKTVVELFGEPSAAAVHWGQVAWSILGVESLAAWTTGLDDFVTDWMIERLKSADERLLILHLDDVDAAGHALRFNCDEPGYLAAIEAQDARIGRLVDAIEPRRGAEHWLVLITTDHGGDDNGHGAINAANQTIFTIAAGDGVVSGQLESANHMDITPTALSYLGVTPAVAFDGQVRGL